MPDRDRLTELQVSTLRPSSDAVQDQIRDEQDDYANAPNNNLPYCP